MRIIIAALVVLLSPVASWAQESVVASVKASVLANGMSISGPCGAFAITQRVAWRLRGSGIGLIAKRAEQNNCQGFGIDALMYRNGDVIDLLVDSGGANGPAWNAHGSTDPNLWRAPVDPGDAIGQVDVPTNPQQPQQPQTPVGGTVTPDVIRAIVASEVDKVYAQNERIFANVTDNLVAILGREDLLSKQLEEHDQKVNKLVAFFSNGKTITALASFFSAYVALKQTQGSN